MDAYTIADALAARYRSGTLTPPTGTGAHYNAVRASTAALPNAIPSSPWVLVKIPQGEIVYGSGVKSATLQAHVYFHLAKHTGDTPRDMTAMLKWLGVLLTATEGQYRLGIGSTQYVKSALVTNFEEAVFTYAGEEFYGWDITVEIILRDEPASLTP